MTGKSKIESPCYITFIIKMMELAAHTREIIFPLSVLYFALQFSTEVNR